MINTNNTMMTFNTSVKENIDNGYPLYNLITQKSNTRVSGNTAKSTRQSAIYIMTKHFQVAANLVQFFWLSSS